MKQIVTALCSFGMSGKVFHAPFLNCHQGFKLYGVWERSHKVAHQIYPQLKSFDTYEALLADSAIELVIVNTPNQTHFEYSKQALEAGKNILVEKPFVATEDQGNELIEIAHRVGKTIAVYQNRRFDSDFKTVKKVIADKLIGEVVEAEIHFDRFKEELSPKQHKEIPGTGTGVLYDLGSHIIDQALVLFGWPKAVFADIDLLRPVSKVDDYFEVLLYYPHLKVRLKASYVTKEPLPGFIIHGTKGSFLKTRADVQENALIAGKVPQDENWGMEPDIEKGFLHTEINGKEVRELVETQQGNYLEYFDQLHRALTSGSSLPVSAEEGLSVIKIIEAAFKSSRERRVVDL